MRNVIREALASPIPPSPETVPFSPNVEVGEKPISKEQVSESPLSMRRCYQPSSDSPHCSRCIDDARVGKIKLAELEVYGRVHPVMESSMRRRLGTYLEVFCD